jgi:hypothetical protein
VSSAALWRSLVQLEFLADSVVAEDDRTVAWDPSRSSVILTLVSTFFAMAGYRSAAGSAITFGLVRLVMLACGAAITVRLDVVLYTQLWRCRARRQLHRAGAGAWPAGAALEESAAVPAEAGRWAGRQQRPADQAEPLRDLQFSPPAGGGTAGRGFGEASGGFKIGGPGSPLSQQVPVGTGFALVSGWFCRVSRLWVLV